jgi:2-methylcitrate dehydratase PrpD
MDVMQTAMSAARAAPERQEPSLSERFAAHVATARYEDLPPDAIAQAKTFILDTFGVGITGSTAAGAAELMAAARAWGLGGGGGGGGGAGGGPAGIAALLNGYQVHCQEFDCLCEPAVLHPMAAVLSAAMAMAERRGGVTGKDLILAAAVGVDVACYLGIASNQALRFFRPATAGGFGAAAATARLAGLPAGKIAHAFGLQLAQMSGTMQAHVEASPALPLQVGMNARAGLQSCDMAEAGLTAPRFSLDGPFGYLDLVEGVYDLAPIRQGLGRRWLIAELSHKPFPAGRATHGVVEAIMSLRRDHGFVPDDIEEIIVAGPPVLKRLTGRPDVPEPTPAYARLCMGYVAAKVLLHGRVGVEHYRGAAELNDPATHELAARVRTIEDGSTNQSALSPQSVVIKLRDGTQLDWRCESMLASPTRRLSREQHLDKFKTCWEFAATPLRASARDELIGAVDRLETMTDVRQLAEMLRAPD